MGTVIISIVGERLDSVEVMTDESCKSAILFFAKKRHFGGFTTNKKNNTLRNPTQWLTPAAMYPHWWWILGCIAICPWDVANAVAYKQKSLLINQADQSRDRQNWVIPCRTLLLCSTPWRYKPLCLRRLSWFRLEQGKTKVNHANQWSTKTNRFVWPPFNTHKVHSHQPYFDSIII